jgi:hypothetical protein
MKALGEHGLPVPQVSMVIVCCVFVKMRWLGEATRVPGTSPICLPSSCAWVYDTEMSMLAPCGCFIHVFYCLYSILFVLPLPSAAGH